MYYPGSSLLNAAASYQPISQLSYGAPSGLSYGAPSALSYAAASPLSIAAQPWASQLPIQQLQPQPFSNSIQPFPSQPCGGLQHFGSYLLTPQSAGSYPYAPYGGYF